MQKIEQVNEATASPKAGELLAAVRKQMGGVPNILATMAQSPAALGGYLGFSKALTEGKLPARLREQIAVAVAGANRCDYCASVHSYVGASLGVDSDELALNLRGRSSDAQAEAALSFAVRIVASRGNIAEADLASVREAGFSTEEIVEIVAHTALNIFTNYFNHIAGTEVDFPLVHTGTAVAA